VWRENGVWDYDDDSNPRLLQPHYFSLVNGKKVDFPNDFLKPFLNRYGNAIRAEDEKTLIFIESVPHKTLPAWSESDLSGIVDSSHWYDDVTLITKRFRWYATLDLVSGRLALGPRKIRQLFRTVLADIKKNTQEYLGDIPTLIGEFGIPFDMHEKKAYRTGRYRKQISALDASFQAIEANLLHATLWNYTPDNTNAHGDLWNDEDLSIFSRDQQNDPGDINSGARAPEAFIRPYPVATAGEPLSLSFDLRRARFEYTFKGDPKIDAPTVIYVPEFHYGEGLKIEVSDGTFRYLPEEQRLDYTPEIAPGEHWIRVWKG